MKWYKGKEKDMKYILKQGIQFFGLSGIGWILDFCIYIVLGIWSKNLFFNNMISSWMGVTFVFFFSTRKIFQNKSKIPLKWKYAIYLLYQCILLYFISKLLSIINNWILAYFAIAIIQKISNILAKVLVTPITMILNFLFMKCIIEKI